MNFFVPENFLCQKIITHASKDVKEINLTNPSLLPYTISMYN
ncbi:MAG: hypothetical protein ACOC0R_00620 [Mariniphaga sp.]